MVTSSYKCDMPVERNNELLPPKSCTPQTSYISILMMHKKFVQQSETKSTQYTQKNYLKISYLPIKMLYYY